MTGELLEMNKAIDTDKGRPQLINRDPLGKGWILKMKATGKINKVPLRWSFSLYRLMRNSGQMTI